MKKISQKSIMGVVSFLAAVLPVWGSVSFATSFSSDVMSGDLKEYAILTEHFQIEYSHIIGLQADSDGDGISDVIEEVAEYAERSWDLEVDQLGFSEPIADGEYVYLILDDRDEYLYEGTMGVTCYFDDFSLYMAIDPWMSSDYLKVTVAHEFMHVLQFGLDFYFQESYQDIYFAEATAVWMEDYVYDDINDYVGYLTDYFDYPDYSVFAGVVPDGTFFEYALGIWPRFLTEYYDDNSLVLDSWNQIIELDSVGNGGFFTVFSAVQDVVEAEGDDIDEVYQDFSIWNLAKEDYYEEGDEYPDVYILNTWSSYPVVNKMPSPGMRPALYGSNYIAFDVPSSGDDFKFTLTKPSGIEMGVSFVPMDGADFDLNALDKNIIGEDETYVELVVENASDYDKVYVVVSPLGAQLTGNTSTFDEGYVYYYSADFGDYSESEEVTSSTDVVIEQEVKEGESSSSNSDGVSVDDELILAVKASDDESVTLSWNRLSDLGIDHYLLYFGSESGNYMGSDEVDRAWTTTSSVNELAPGEVYYFMIEAYSIDDELLISSSEVAAETATFSFSDMDSSDEAYDAVIGLYEIGIIEGYDDGTFGAENTVNRAELLKILIEGVGTIEISDDYANCFDDVSDEWYAKYVCYAKEQGWVSGYDDGNFYPAQTVNKVEALKMLLMVFGYELEEGSYISGGMPYSDTWPTSWYAIYVDTAFDLGILSEEEGGVFEPEEGRNRGEICMELWELINSL
ncbi:hypothetical protein A2344_02655 [Candidatus Peregrinibacteria bacterium RIFOXYB12_FULL_41_12]|nr:MAG: hypothetical protein A2344_02655 [Candidatus Peregrinibacteria bacterium RIFOXYB12_FULL_41_12]OGJ53198.1 MAG: hypothetical protein A2448_01135 [Candidatus Peregrinibacteria bacterium RIFOXYC2_FULL_41_22]